jgi:hypothetical protein
MVMDRSIDFTDSLDDYMEDGEVQDESAPFFSDEDLQNEFQAPTMVNPARKAAGSFEIPWKALRLPGARGGDRWLGPQAMSSLGKTLGGRVDDIRSSPYAYVISAKTWNQYINNMDETDMGAELNADISETEKASLYLFTEEWENTDRSHEAFKRRLIDHSLVNLGDEMAKGQMVADVVLNRVGPRGGRGNVKHAVMFRLAMDILQSIRLRYYNFYSVNLLHQHEGAELYKEFLSRYVPLDADEVAVIQEIDMGIKAQGRQYAVATTSPLTDAITTYNLMQRIVESYAIGDTMTARAAIAVLLQAPINYRSSMKFTVSTDSMGRSSLVRDGKVIATNFKNGKIKDAFKDNPKVRFLVAESITHQGKKWPTTNDGRTDKSKLEDFKKVDPPILFVEVKGINDPTPMNIVYVENDNIRAQDYESYMKMGRAAAEFEASENLRADGKRQGRNKDSVRVNPVGVGQGQHFFIQLKPKSQFSFTKQQKKMGSTSKGTMTVVGTPGRDSTGLGDIFGGFEASGYVAWKGTHKDSGSKEAWIIQLPRKYGKGKKRGKGGNVVFKKARVTDKDTGRSYSTIRPFGADPAIKAAWAKFLKTYGEPIFAEDPKRPNLFRIRRKNRGSHYKRK